MNHRLLVSVAVLALLVVGVGGPAGRAQEGKAAPGLDAWRVQARHVYDFRQTVHPFALIKYVQWRRIAPSRANTRLAHPDPSAQIHCTFLERQA